MKGKIKIIVVLFTFLTAGISTAQVINTATENKIETKAVANLVMACFSDNAGLRTSAIELVRENNLKQVVDALIYILNEEESESIKVMAAVTLYQIGNPTGIKAIFNSVKLNGNDLADELNTALLVKYNKNK